MQVSPVTVTRSLGQDCAQCALLNGLSVPKPAFSANASSSSSLPSDIVAATLTGGALAITVQNGFNFDPLRPSASARGYVITTITNGSVVIGRDSVDGANAALPAGGSLTRTVPLSGSVSSAVPVTVSMVINSPAGDPVQMDASRFIVATATPTGLKVATANVAVLNRQVNTISSIDLASVDSAITNKVQSGGLVLSITNPFQVAGILNLRLTPDGGAPINKTVTLSIASAATTQRVDFSKSELRALLGHTVTMTIAGAVTSNGSNGSTSVSPKQAVVVTSRLDLNIEVGG
jgi:hypothetical protein